MLNYNKEQLFKVSLFLIIIFFSFYRSPYIFINGRFFAEEGLHFVYVWKNDSNYTIKIWPYPKKTMTLN